MRLVPLALLVLAASPAAGAVLCAKAKADGTFSATVRIREVCRDRETALLPDMVGWQCACPGSTTTTSGPPASTSTAATTSTTTSTTVPDVSGRWYFTGTITATECPAVHPMGADVSCGPPNNSSCYFDVAQDGTTLDVHLSNTVPNFAGTIDVSAGSWTWGPCTYGNMTVEGFTSSAPAVWDWHSCYDPECSYTVTGTVTRP